MKKILIGSILLLCVSATCHAGLTNYGKATFNGASVDDDDCTSEQGKMWYDTTDSAFEFCNDNSGTPDVLGSGSGGSAITLDLGDDGGDDSTDLEEIAIINDTNSIFTESADDKLLINWSNAVPLADALADNGANCSSGNAPLGVDASGAVESCFDVWTEAENTSAGYIASEVNDLETDGAENIADTEIIVGTGAGTTNYVVMSGDATLANTGALTIGDDKVLEAMLKAVDSASDEECLTYEETTGDFEWQSCGSGSSEWTDAGQELHPADNSGAETVIIGGTGASTSDIILGAEGGATFNEQSASVDFRVESNDSTHALFVDGSENWVGINTDTPNEYGLGSVGLAIRGTTANPYIIMHRDSNSMTDGQGAGGFYLYAGTTPNLIGAMEYLISGTDEIGSTLRFYTETEGGTLTTAFEIDPSQNFYMKVAGSTLFIGGLIDAVGAVDMDYGSGDITDHTFITDGTGDTEIVLPAQSIGASEILNDTITRSQIADADQTGAISVTIESPTDADDIIIARFDEAVTVTGMDCIVEDATSAVLVLVECDADGDNCGTSRFTESVTCAVTNTSDDGVAEAGIVAGATLRAQVGTVTGTPGHLNANLYFTVDD